LRILRASLIQSRSKTQMGLIREDHWRKSLKNHGCNQEYQAERQRLHFHRSLLANKVMTIGLCVL